MWHQDMVAFFQKYFGMRERPQRAEPGGSER
jgi:hypothetical protein